MSYNSNKYKKRRPRYIALLAIVGIIVSFAIVGIIGTRFWYENQLKPVSQVSQIVVIEIPKGANVQEIADELAAKKVIRSSQAFQFYVRNNSLNESLKAGIYELDAAKTTPQIVTAITKGDVREDLFTILPGQRLGQVQEALIEYGYSKPQVERALDPAQYAGHPALVAKPSNQSLEGYLYPESFKINASTTPEQIITKSLDEMAEKVTPDLIDAWQKQGLGIHQAISLASIVENEVAEKAERATVAGVFYNRLNINMRLESDPTYLYAGYILGLPGNRQIDSPYNTYRNAGIPPGPISNVSISSLEAVAYPKANDYLFFVAGDDGITRFSKTLEEHQENTAKYCIELCKSY
jgi:UPF0755 protein